MRFYWKLISDDGLLKEPIVYEGYGRGEKLNNYDGFETREAAIEELKRHRKGGAFRYDEMLLIEVY